MTYSQTIIKNLKQSPMILKGMLNDIPKGKLKIQRHKGKWSIHEHTCHLAEAESMILQRFKEFKNNETPTFTPYLPGVNIDADQLLNKELNQELSRYELLRRELVDLVSTFDEKLWVRPAEHHEYVKYNALILLRHTLMHDHFHMYKIEELWLTKDEFYGNH